MKDALDVHRSLLAREVPHEVVRLPRLVLSADEIPDVMGLPAERCIATRIYHCDDHLVAVLVRATEQPHPGAVLAALRGRSLRAAEPGVVNAVTDFAATLVSPLLLPGDMPVLADACVGHVDVVYAATGDGGTVIGIPSRWLLTATGAVVAELCSPSSPTVDLADDIDIDVDALVARRRDWR